MSDIPAASGIYKITCTANKRTYVGSAINLRRRRKDHFSKLRENKHSNLHLQRAWNKYGEQSFAFEVLDLVLPMSLTAREQYWFNKLRPFGRRGFNIAHDAISNKPSSETREKMRQAALGRKMSPEARERMRLAQIGKKHLPEAIEKIRQGNLGKKMSPESIEKRQQSRWGRREAVQP